MPYKNDRERADQFIPQIRSILGGLPLAHFAEIQDAPIEVDRKYATDLTLKVTGCDIASRLRFPPCNYRDLTIRAHRDNGIKTELAKIEEGFANRYFYGWIDEKQAIHEWILANVDKMRDRGLLKNRNIVPNYDGTHFIAIPVIELYREGCLIAYQLDNKVSSKLKQSRQVNVQASSIKGVNRAGQGYNQKGQPRTKEGNNA
jgi:hypothetical protein